MSLRRAGGCQPARTAGSARVRRAYAAGIRGGHTYAAGDAARGPTSAARRAGPALPLPPGRPRRPPRRGRARETDVARVWRRSSCAPCPSAGCALGLSRVRARAACAQAFLTASSVQRSWRFCTRIERNVWLHSVHQVQVRGPETNSACCSGCGKTRAGAGAAGVLEACGLASSTARARLARAVPLPCSRSSRV